MMINWQNKNMTFVFRIMAGFMCTTLQLMREIAMSKNMFLWDKAVEVKPAFYKLIFILKTENFSKNLNEISKKFSLSLHIYCDFYSNSQ